MISVLDFSALAAIVIPNRCVSIKRNTTGEREGTPRDTLVQPLVPWEMPAGGPRPAMPQTQPVFWANSEWAVQNAKVGFPGVCVSLPRDLPESNERFWRDVSFIPASLVPGGATGCGLVLVCG